MFRWIPYAFIRIALYFIAGIISGIFFPDMVPERTGIVLLLAMSAFYVLCYGFFRYGNKQYFNLGLAGLPAVFLAGYVHVGMKTQSGNPDHFIAISQPVRYYKVTIDGYPEEKQRSWKMVARIDGAYASEWRACTGKIILYFSKTDLDKPYRYGDKLLVKGAPQPIPAPANPGEFDYRKFLRYRNTYHQHFLRSGEVTLLGNDRPSRVVGYAIDARLWANSVLTQHVRGDRERAIASALVLGVTDGLDNELLGAYSATGTMHILAVSGLHVSIIYMIILWIMKPVRRTRAGQWLLAVAALFVLWSYAFVTGLSPSVLRAVTMFSFIAIARPTRQGTNIYNTLAASAFFLLIFDPYLIMSVGFQLSYLAVLGIVYLGPRLYRLWEPQHALAEKIWRLTTVSVAAQIATFVLGLYYFHQFPNYFLLSNLLVIPISFVVLVLGIGVLAFSFVQAISAMLGLALTGAIWLLNQIVFTMESFPYSLIEDIHINAFQCWLLIGIIVAFILLMEFRRFRYAAAAFVMAVLFAGFQWQHFDRDVDVRKITVYSIRGHSAIDLIDRGHAFFLTDSLLAADDRKIGFHIAPNRLTAGIARVVTGQQPFIRNFAGGRIIRWGGKTIVHITGDGFTLPDVISPEWIVISNNAVRDFASLARSHPAAAVILDSSNSFYYARQCVEAVPVRDKLHSVPHQGAYDVILSQEKA